MMSTLELSRYDFIQSCVIQIDDSNEVLQIPPPDKVVIQGNHEKTGQTKMRLYLRVWT